MLNLRASCSHQNELKSAHITGHLSCLIASGTFKAMLLTKVAAALNFFINIIHQKARRDSSCVLRRMGMREITLGWKRSAAEIILVCVLPTFRLF